MAGRMSTQTLSQTSPSSAAPASTRSSRTRVEHQSTTPYGDPSARSRSARSRGGGSRSCPATAATTGYPPHGIPYRANAWALRSLGVRQVLAPCAVGGLGDGVAPGDVVVPDQLVDRTFRRVGSFVESGACHLPFADPYCPGVSAAGGRRRPTSVRRHDGRRSRARGSPRAPSRATTRRQGWNLINMTGAPEAALAREMRQCYAAIALVTDMDAGAESGQGVGQEEVFGLFRANLERLTGLLTQRSRRCPTPTAARARRGPTASSSPTTCPTDLPIQPEQPRERVGDVTRVRRGDVRGVAVGQQVADRHRAELRQQKSGVGSTTSAPALRAACTPALTIVTRLCCTSRGERQSRSRST